MFRLNPLLFVLLASAMFWGCSSRPKGNLSLSLGIPSSFTPDTNNAIAVLQVVGEASWQGSPNSPSQPLMPGAVLPLGAVVTSERDGQVEILLPRGAGSVTIEADSRIVFTQGEGDELLAIYVAHGRVSGSLRSDSLRLFNGCGASLDLTPQPGMSAPFSFGSTLPQELWDAMIGLRLNPDVLLPPLPSEGALGRVPNTYVSPVGSEVIPEPSVWSLSVLGIGTVVFSATLTRRHWRQR